MALCTSSHHQWWGLMEILMWQKSQVTNPGPSIQMVLPWLLEAGGWWANHILSKELNKNHFEGIRDTCSTSVQCVCSYFPCGEWIRTFENLIPVDQPGRLWCGQFPVSCLNCMHYLKNVSEMWPCTKKWLPVDIYNIKFPLSYSIFRCKVNRLLFSQEG